MNLTGKIGIYGRSLGGIPSSHLTPRVDLVIVDRSFSSFDSMATYRYFNRLAANLFRVGSFGW